MILCRVSDLAYQGVPMKKWKNFDKSQNKTSFVFYFVTHWCWEINLCMISSIFVWKYLFCLPESRRRSRQQLPQIVFVKSHVKFRFFRLCQKSCLYTFKSIFHPFAWHGIVCWGLKSLIKMLDKIWADFLVPFDMFWCGING